MYLFSTVKTKTAVVLAAVLLCSGLLCQAPAVADGFSIWNPLKSLTSSSDAEAREKAREAAKAEKEAKKLEEQAQKAREEAAKLKQEARKAQAKTQAADNKKEQARLQAERKAQEAILKDAKDDAQNNKQASTAKEEGSKWNPLNWDMPNMNMLGVFDGDDEDAKKDVSDKRKEEKDKLVQESVQSPELPPIDENKTRGVIIQTERGDIYAELYPEQAPITVANFIKLVFEGFYNQPGMKFHRVIPGFVAQTGDPTGTGTGGSKERIPLEVKNKLSHQEKGYLGMARGPDPNSATSQFYMTLAPQKSLDGKYAVFGKIIKGVSVLDSIQKGDRLYGIKFIDPTQVARDPKPESTSTWKKWF